MLQGLIVLFCGAMAQVLAPSLLRLHRLSSSKASPLGTGGG